MESPVDRANVWLPLLQELSRTEPTWLVWKNVDSALHAEGDIDSAASPDAWGLLTDVFLQWVDGRDLWPAIECRHIPGGLNLVAAPDREPTLLEVSIKENKVWRGSTLFHLSDLLSLAEDDERGFRRLRPGAEGVFKLLLNGTRWSGAPNAKGLRDKQVRRLLAMDPDGARRAAELFGPLESRVVALANATAAGDWNRFAALSIEAYALSRALAHPSVTARRAHFRTRSSHTCPVLDVLLGTARRPPTDRRSWLEDVCRSHVVHSDPASLERTTV